MALIFRANIGSSFWRSHASQPWCPGQWAKHICLTNNTLNPALPNDTCWFINANKPKGTWHHFLPNMSTRYDKTFSSSITYFLYNDYVYISLLHIGYLSATENCNSLRIVNASFGFYFHVYDRFGSKNIFLPKRNLWTPCYPSMLVLSLKTNLKRIPLSTKNNKSETRRLIITHFRELIWLFFMNHLCKLSFPFKYNKAEVYESKSSPKQNMSQWKRIS